MSETPSPPPPSEETGAPWVAKRRLPFDAPKEKRHPGLTAAAAVYGVAALVALAIGAYMFIQGQPLVSVPVLASIAIGIWFFVRMLMMLRPRGGQPAPPPEEG